MTFPLDLLKTHPISVSATIVAIILALIYFDIIPGVKSFVMGYFNNDEGYSSFPSSEPAEIPDTSQPETTLDEPVEESSEVPKEKPKKKKKKESSEEASQVLGFSSNDQYATI